MWSFSSSETCSFFELGAFSEHLVSERHKVAQGDTLIRRVNSISQSEVLGRRFRPHVLEVSALGTRI